MSLPSSEPPAPWAQPEPLTPSPGPARERAPVEARIALLRQKRRPPFPFRLRPMSAVDVADNAFAVLKSQPRLLCQLVLPLVLPLIAWQTYARRTNVGQTMFDYFDAPGRFGWIFEDGSQVGLFALDLAVLALAGVLVSRVVAAWFLDQLPTARQVWRDALPLMPAALVAFVTVHLLELVTAAILVPFCAVVMPALAIERLGPFAALRRSFSLVRPHFGRVLGYVLLTAFVVFLTGVLLGWLPISIASALEEDGYLVAGVASALIEVITTSFVALGAAILYLDLRVRVEGMDIELAARDKFRA